MKKLVLAIALAVASGPVATVEAAKPKDSPDPAVVNNSGFLSYHPDLRFRRLALQAFADGRPDEALTYFKRAARYADKPSQGMVAEMLWRGDGVQQDRAEAYAWMDLAAERGYRTMAIQREKYWKQLDQAERDRALEKGAALYAEFGDEVAKPRLETFLRRGRKSVTGSRTGFTGNVQIIIPTLSGDHVIDGSNFFHPSYWDPKEYWTWQDKGWTEPPKGVVDIGPMQVGAAEPDAESSDEAGKR